MPDGWFVVWRFGVCTVTDLGMGAGHLDFPRVHCPFPVYFSFLFFPLLANVNKTDALESSF